MNHNQLARLCAESYQHASFNVGECEGIVEFEDDRQIIAFRGTEAGALFDGAGWLDVIRDLRILPWHDPETGWCHSGFLKGGMAVAEFLAKHLVVGIPVVCTGHSLGGAVALICAAKLQAAGYEIVEWVGFGSPKVQLSRRLYDFPQVNYRYRADIVPLLPRLMPYRHNGLEKRLLPDYQREPNWFDHNIQHYVRHVE